VKIHGYMSPRLAVASLFHQFRDGDCLATHAAGCGAAPGGVLSSRFHSSHHQTDGDVFVWVFGIDDFLFDDFVSAENFLDVAN
jgi:hypothetical protein